MKIKQLVIVACALTCALVSISCSTVEPIPKKADMAMLEINTQTGKGKGSVTTVVKSVDGQSINQENGYLPLAPGHHIVAFSYSKLVSPGSSINLSIQILDREIVPQNTETVLDSVSDVNVEGNFQAGKAYCVDASGIAPQPTESSSSSPLSVFGPPMFESMINGARIREKQ